MKNEYSNVKYFDCWLMEGGMHVCTTEKEILFNLNDLFNLLNISKDVAKNWKERVYTLDKVSFERNGRKVFESFICSNDITFILNLYGKDLLERFETKRKVEEFIYKIIFKYESDNNVNFNTYNTDLSYEFALETLKQFSKDHDNQLAVPIEILERYNVNERLDNDYNFINKEEQKDNKQILSYDELVEQVRKELNEK